MAGFVCGSLWGVFRVGVGDVCVAELSTRTCPAYLVLLTTASLNCFLPSFPLCYPHCAHSAILLYSQSAINIFWLTQRHRDSSLNNEGTNRQHIYLNDKSG